MIESDSKKLLRDYGLTFCLLAVMTGILIPFILTNRKSWYNGLGGSVQTVLNDYDPGTYQVGSPVILTSLFSVSAAAFHLVPVHTGTGTASLGVILRIPTLYGPQPAVFTYDEHTGAQFIGYALPQGKVADALSHTQADARIQYWCKQLPLILKKSGGSK